MQMNAVYSYLFMPAIEWVLFLLWFWLYILNDIRANNVERPLELRVLHTQFGEGEMRANVNIIVSIITMRSEALTGKYIHTNTLTFIHRL